MEHSVIQRQSDVNHLLISPLFLSKKRELCRNLLSIICLLFSILPAYAYEEQNLLQHEADKAKLASSLLLNQNWVPYPAYTDRADWDALTGTNKEAIIRKGEEALAYRWKVIVATDYLEYDRSGNRKIMENPLGENNSAFSHLVLAELAEGKGRFIDQIANGVWFYCEMTSWALSAHVGREQAEQASLPSYKEHVLELTSGDMGSFLAWTYYFLKERLDKVNPLIAERLRKNIQERILDPYMNRDNFWWQAFDAKPQTLVNNWNPWCNFNVLSCFLLLENNPEKLATAVYRTMISVDKFINRSNADGACEEGPSYWGHAAGKLYDYLQILSMATAGKVTIFDQPMIRNMGEYISKSYIGKGWVVNFADASAQGGGEFSEIFCYGKAVKSVEMQQFAAYLYQQKSKESNGDLDRDMFRTLGDLACRGELEETEPAVAQVKTVWYPQTQFCYMRNATGFFFAAKGGYNNESHNHNDVGSFILYRDQTPMIIDAGVGTYTRQTFSNERYSIWTMQSNYHNLPMVNGVPQSFGTQYRANNVTFDSQKLLFSLDIAKAYPKEAAVKKWVKNYQLQPNGLVEEDVFELTEKKFPNQLNFLIPTKPEISIPGVVVIEKDGVKLKIKYDKNQFETGVEVITLSDIRLSNVWGKQIFLLSLKARQQQISGKYKLIFSK
jgi:hypothetical protein